MPILGLTDRPPVPPRLGKIRKGDPKQTRVKDGKEYEVVGRDRDTFRVTFDSQYAPFQQIFTDLYTDSPVEFRNVMLLGSSADDLFGFEAWYEERSANKLLHRCDGHTQESRYVNGENVHDGAACIRNATPACHCTERGSLKVVLMDFTISSGLWGYFAVETGSIYDIINISSYLRFIEQFQMNQGLRFVLGRAPKTVSVPNPKKVGERMRTEKSLLYLMVEPAQTQNYLIAALNQRDQLALSGAVDTTTGEISAGKESALMGNEQRDGVSQIPARVQSEDFVPPEYQFNETDLEPLNKWDMSEVENATSHLFNAPNHQQNALHKLMEDGKLTPDMDTAQAVAAVIESRRNRRAEKLEDGSWWLDKEMVKEFCQSVQTVAPNMSGGDILKALNKSRLSDPATKLSQFKGTSRSQAWALCLLYSTDEDNYEQARAKANDPDIIAYLDDMEAAQWYDKSAPTGDIPF